MDLIHYLDAIQTIAVPVLATIGITGGLKGLAGGVPDLDLGNLHVPGGLWLSWTVALVWIVGGIVVHGGPPPGTDLAAYLAVTWPTVAALANIVRNWITPLPVLA